MARVGLALVCGAAALLLLGSALAADAAEAVTTTGTGTLTMCRDWLVYASCTAYHNVAVPEVIAIGDKVRLHFGSNPKTYEFPVVGIHRHGDGCTVVSEHTGADESGEKIEVAPCNATAKPGGSP